MLFLNPPDHTRIRSLVSRAFTPRRVEELRPAITAMLTPVLDRFADQGGGNVVTDLAVPFPVAVISELLGVPPEDSAALEPDIHAGTALIDATLDEDRRAKGEAAVQRVADGGGTMADVVQQNSRHAGLQFGIGDRGSFALNDQQSLFH